MNHTIKWQISGTSRWRNKEGDSTKRLKGKENEKHVHQVETKSEIRETRPPPCTTTTTNFSGQQGRCNVHYPPLGRHFGLVTLNQSAQGNLSTRSLDSRVSQRETNAHFNVKIGLLRKTFHSSNSFLKSRPAWFAFRCYRAASWTPTMLLYKVASRAWHKWGLYKWILVL